MFAAAVALEGWLAHSGKHPKSECGDPEPESPGPDSGRCLLVVRRAHLVFANTWRTNWIRASQSDNVQSSEASFTTLQETGVPKPDTGIRSTHSTEGGIVMDIGRGKMFSLNASGSAMFELLTNGCEEKAILDELVRRFEIPASVAKQDLDAFRETLKRQGVFPGPRDASLE